MSRYTSTFLYLCSTKLNTINFGRGKLSEHWMCDFYKSLGINGIVMEWNWICVICGFQCIFADLHRSFCCLLSYHWPHKIRINLFNGSFPLLVFSFVNITLYDIVKIAFFDSLRNPTIIIYTWTTS